MLSEQRYEKISGLLESEGSVKTSTLCSLLSASRETIRRDLETMEAQGLLRRIRGGAMKLEPSKTDSQMPGVPVQEKNESLQYASFDKRQKQHFLNKEKVARKAAEYISEGQAIALDSGTTALELARVIRHRFHSLTVVTNSLPVAAELADAEGITLVLTGGIYNSDEKAFTSDLATLIFSRINIDILFLTTCGISVERGITYQRVDEIIVQDRMMEASGKTIVIADSSKIGVNSLVKMCGIDRISMIITDSNAPAEQTKALEQAGVQVVISQDQERNEE
ncbi:MAG: DeoR/GlpR family DNA-binding transcription regulator [Lachnospiraceae bacterium]|nr:DeoR/GlpR family DNA-binding transcription regulator [Lachnospiraceae bacterium]